MKYLLALLLFVPSLSIAQDKIFLRNGNTIDASVKKSTPKEIEYVFSGEETVNVIDKNSVFKIEYESGRVEMVPYNGSRDVERNPRPKAKSVFRIGVKAGANLPLISNLDAGLNNKIGGLIGVTTETKFLGTVHSISIELYANQILASDPDNTVGYEAVYLSLPLLYTNSVSDRVNLSIGPELSFPIYSDIVGGGTYYNVANITNDVNFGLSGGIRYFIMPKSWFVDVRGTAAFTDIFTISNGKPNKVNLSIGYIIKY